MVQKLVQKLARRTPIESYFSAYSCDATKFFQNEKFAL